ncbi:chloroplast outer envelope [Fagus crenata]
MAENNEISSSKEDPKGPMNLFSLFPKFKLDIPFLKQEPKVEVVVKKEVKKEIVVVVGDEGKEDTNTKPDVVKFSERKPLIPPPLAIEAEESSAKTSNPFILWQVYALGGVIVLKWIWARWQERRAQKGSSDDDNDESSDVE